MQSRLRHFFSATIFGNRRTGIVSSLVLMWCVFVARGVFYPTVIPVWEGYDEPFHFAFVQCLVTSNRLPIPTTLVSREIQASFYSLPLPWTLQNLTRDNPIFTHDSFWKLERQQRENLQRQFLQIPKQWAKESATQPISNYESQQPPLYYLLLSVPFP